MHKGILKTALPVVLLTAAIQLQAQSLRVGTDPGYAPFEYIDDNTKQLTGFEVELMVALGQVQDLDLEFSSVDFDYLLSSLNDNKLDIAFGAITVTPERKAQVLFSDPVYASGIGVMVHKAYSQSINNVDLLKDQPVCVQQGSEGMAYAQAHMPQAILDKYTSFEEALGELRKGSCVGLLSDYAQIAYYMGSQQPDNLVMLDANLNSQPMALAVRSTDTQLAESLNEGLKKLKDIGYYDQLVQKYFGGHN